MNNLRPGSIALLALACGIAASVAAWAIAARQAEAEAQARFAGHAGLAANVIERRVQRYVDMLYGVQALAHHEAQISREEFGGYVSALGLSHRFPAVRAVEFIRRVTDRERDAFVAAVRANDALEPALRSGFDIRPPGRRPEYWVIDYIEPIGWNKVVFGLDVHALPGARLAAQRAVDTGEPSATGRYRLVQEPGTSYGLVIYLPVFAPDADAGGHRSLRGLVNTVLRMDDLFAGIDEDPLVRGLTMAIEDAGRPGADAKDGADAGVFYRTPLAMQSSLAPWQTRLRHDVDLSVAGRHWRVRFESTPAPTPWLARAPLFALGVALGFSFLLFGYLWTLARARSAAVATADNATRELRMQLSYTQQLSDLARDSNERLRAVIEAAPVAIVARDLDGVIRMWNPAAERMLGWKEEEVLETRTSIVPDALQPQLQDWLARVRAGEALWIEETRNRCRDGREIDTSMSIAPVYGADGKVMGTLATLTDITRRKQAEAALRERESQLRLAMEAAQMGMWYWEIDTDRFIHSERLPPLFGSPAGEIVDDYRALQTRLHPDDRDIVEATLRHAVKHGSDFQVDYRVLWPDGTVHWLSNRGQVHRAPSGRAERVIGVAMDITERKLAEQRAAHMAHHDALTGLPNRVLLRDRIQQAIAHAHRNRSQLALLFLDLDRFKAINDSLGHDLGDRLLQSVASRILVCVREGDTVARVGGDEFVVVIPALASAADASAVASKILEVLATAYHLDGNELHAGASIGISLYPADGHDAETLMRNADTAMYHAKDSGRGNYQFFTEHMNVAAQERLALENALRHALENHEFELQYLPVYELRTRTVTGFEALLRWKRPGGEPMPPKEFVAAAEDCGLIVPIGEWVLREALRQARAWQAPGRPVSVAVNVSAHQLARPSFVQRLRAMLEETQFDPALLELEVTEAVIIEGAGEACEALDHIAALGVSISIDDFGTGYSGLANLKRLPIDTVKIDQSFVRHLTADPDDAAIVTAIVAMASSLGLEVVAEGVETAEQLQALQRLGCHRGQGFLLSRPVGAAAAARLLRASAVSEPAE